MEKSIFRRDRKNGFTLVEILVVIAIIAILAATLTVAAGPAINAAKRAKANVVANQIQTAILNYYTEYGVYPVPTTTAADYTYAGPDEGDLMVALCGDINASTGSPQTPATVSNTRQIAYLTPKRTDVDGSGILLNPFNPPTPPTYFSIEIDGDYSGVLGDNGSAPPDFSGSPAGTGCPPGGKKITQGVAVWADCDPATNSTTPAFWVHTY